jgi:hypothetical protein
MNGMRMTARFQLFALAGLVAAAAGCGDVVRDSRSPAILVVSSLQGGLGNGSPLAANVLSDVITNVRSPAPCTNLSPCPTVFNDVGQASLSLVMKNVTVQPTSNNQVTITRYTVAYRRNDGHNTPGVDVPYPFDAAVTVTVPPGATTSVGFELTRIVAKEEAPLVQLQTNPNFIATIADVTFYGHDVVGNAVSATGSILVEFGNYGDF